MRCMGMVVCKACTKAGWLRIMSVSTTPGMTALTRTPLGASSMAALRVKPRKAHLLHE